MNSEEKTKFRGRKEWKEFRKQVKTRKVDAITGKPLTKMFHVHHMDMNEEHYTDLNPENFLALNNMSHDTWHFIYGSPKGYKDWRKIIAKLVETFELADKINGRA